MTLELPSKEDFDVLSAKLDKIHELLEEKQKSEPGAWMKSTEVKNLLRCSDAALKTYRDRGIIPSTKIGGRFYYRKDVVEKQFQG